MFDHDGVALTRGDFFQWFVDDQPCSKNADPSKGDRDWKHPSCRCFWMSSIHVVAIGFQY